MSERLTENFTLAEAIHSNTAVARGIDNRPGPAAMANIVKSAEGMQAVRGLVSAKAGRDVPITVTSWYRNAEVNRAVGGSPTSDHVTGWAVDFRCAAPMDDAVEVARLIIASPLMFDQLILYPGPRGRSRLHLSFAPRDRREVLTKLAGSPVYEAGLHP